MSTDMLRWLESWYSSQCNGDWEHQYGVQIGTLDNPGWSLEIDLADTSSEAVLQTKGELSRSVDDWLRYEVKELKFVGFCGPRNLNELLEVFRDAVQHKQTVEP